MIILQYICPKSFTINMLYCSGRLHTKTKAKYTFFDFVVGYVRDLLVEQQTHVTGTPDSPFMPG
jgi:hypothetical protein